MKKFLLAVCLLSSLSAIARADTQQDVTDLTRRLKSDDADDRERAAEALGAMGPDAAPAVKALRQALNDELPYVRTHSAEALSKIGPAAIPAFIDALKNDNAEVRAIAASALGKYGDDSKPAIPALVNALQDSDLPVRQGVARALEQIGLPAVPALVQHLEDSRGTSKVLTLQVLSTLQGAGGEVIGPMIKLLNDEDNQVRLAAAKALVHQGSGHTPELMEGLKSDNANVRAQVAGVLGDIGKRSSAAVPSLTELLKDTSSNVRGSAAQALGKMGSSAASAVPALRETAKDSDASVATKAAEALTNITSLFGNESKPETKIAKASVTPSVAVAPIIKKAPPKKKPAAKPTTKKVMKKAKPLPPPPPPTPDVLIMQLQSPDVAISSNAAQAIVLRSSETAPLLIQSLQGGSTTLAEMSADLLTKIGTDDAKKAVETYRKHLDDKRTASLLRNLRQEGKASDDAAQELVKIGAPIVKPVSDVLKDQRPASRLAAAKVLNQLGSVAAPATSSLIDALDDKNPDVRQQAAEALGKINTPEAKKALRFFSIKDKAQRLMSVVSH